MSAAERLDIGGNVTDAALLRALAEDVPDMALSVRERLRGIASMLDEGLFVGCLRCRRCGEKTEVRITTAKAERGEPAR